MSGEPRCKKCGKLKLDHNRGFYGRWFCDDEETLFEPAEPSPAPPVERVIEVAPQGEIPTAFDQSRGWEAIIKWAYANNDDGVLAVRDIAREFVDWRARAQTAESALTAARTERDREAEYALKCDQLRWRAEEERDRLQSDLAAMGTDLGVMVEERDRAQDALRKAMPILEHFARENPIWHDFTGRAQDPEGVHALLAALRPVSDRHAAPAAKQGDPS